VKILQTRNVVIAVVVALVAAGAVVALQQREHRVTAYFTTSTGLYAGDEVKVLGVAVGKIAAIHPEGKKVRVEMDVDAGQRFPREAKAAIVSPSLVSGRFVQIFPAYAGGPALADGATIPLSRTAVPVSFDEVKKQLTDLATALGPQGTDKTGALDRILTSVDANLDEGTDVSLRQSLTEMRRAAETLASGRQDLFATISNLNTFIANLVANDQALRRFTKQLAQFSEVLAANRKAIEQSLHEVQGALKQVQTYVDTNERALGTSVKELNELVATVSNRSDQVAGILHVAPHAVNNFYNTFSDQAVTGRATLNNLDGVAQLLCGAILGTGGTAEQCQQAVQPLLTTLGLSELPLHVATGPEEMSDGTRPPAVSGAIPTPAPEDLLAQLTQLGQTDRENR
jgi:phospholipid/cholesterol/gamma-HCH transport system substrate-binding protein